MATPRRKPLSWFVAALVWTGLCAQARAEPPALDSLRDIVVRLHSCWRPPPLSVANPIDITVVVSFTREGGILGHPRITYESEGQRRRPAEAPHRRKGDIATLHAVAIYLGTGRRRCRPAARNPFQNPQTSTQT